MRFSSTARFQPVEDPAIATGCFVFSPECKSKRSIREACRRVCRPGQRENSADDVLKTAGHRLLDPVSCPDEEQGGEMA
ncbi:MAG: hypothetical protein ACE5FS_14070, partial [Paracoccaceae bacterium]